MKDVHAIVGIATLGLNALAAVWGGVAWLRSDPSVTFWYVLRTAQLSVVVSVVLGLVRLAAYLQSSAPLRHTNTKATNSSTMNVITSPSA